MKSGTHLKAVTQTEREMGAWLENGVNKWGLFCPDLCPGACVPFCVLRTKAASSGQGPLTVFALRCGPLAATTKSILRLWEMGTA